MTQWAASSDGGTGGDEHGAEDDGPQDPPEQQPVLVRGGDGEGGEHQGEDEDVVDRERQLDQVAREILAARRAALGGSDVHPEPECERHPHDTPEGRLPERDDLRLAVEHEQVQGEHAADDGEEQHPGEELRGHRCLRR